MTLSTLKVLRCFLEQPHDSFAGSDIASHVKLASGTLYPILLRLEGYGWLQSEWEDGEPSNLNRPRKRLYRFTALGQKSAAQQFIDNLGALPS